MNASALDAPAVRGLIGGGGRDRAAATPAWGGLAWGWPKLAPPAALALPAAALVALLLVSAALSRETWQLLRSLDRRCRSLSPRQARILARVAARRGLGPVVG
jgi:hypothetical protein